MKCTKCGKKAETNLAPLGRLCKNCFCTTVEKRIRKDVRINRVFSKGDRIIAVGELNQYLIPRIIKGLPAEIVKTKNVPKSSSKKEKVVVNWTLDDEVCDFLKNVFSNSQKQRRCLSIVRVATDRELERFSRFKHIDFNRNEKDRDIMKMLNTLERKHPETKFSLFKSKQQMEEFLKT